MKPRRLLWQIYPLYLLITALSLAAVTWYATRIVRDTYLKRTREELAIRARLVEAQMASLWDTRDAEAFARRVRRIAQDSAARITLILPDGKVLADSEEEPARMDNHADRPEIQQALAGQVGSSVRFSDTRRQNMMYVAVPLQQQGRIAGAVRVSIPISFVDDALSHLYRRMALAGLVIIALGAAASLHVSRRISRPLEELRQGAQRFSRGQLDTPLPVPESVEMAALARTMNTMAAQLDSQIQAAVRERNEAEAVLSSMGEGVLVVDREERLVRLNRAAAELLGCEEAESRGRSIQEIVRNVELQELLSAVLEKQELVERRIQLQGLRERFLQAHATPLRNPRGELAGVLLVMHDVTELRHLENVRRQFVANVSHELKTPITSIKAAAETLLDGAWQQEEDAKRFLHIILRQSDRLHAIIEDLLSLSRIEQETEKAHVALSEGRIDSVLQAALEACEVKAMRKNIRVQLSCDEEMTAGMNAPLMEQAIINLIDNAIKYSPEGSTIEVLAERQEGGAIALSVRDEGCGIEPQHLDRIFERFYRVDKGRSRALGGTGLGLAIVKHIAQAHGGRITVQSTPGGGSCFTLHLPG